MRIRWGKSGVAITLNIDPQLWEVIKLGASFVGALAITWLAVGWALRRFQREKAWERRFTTYVDAITAMAEMRLIIGIEIDEIESHREPTDEVREERSTRYRLAKRQFEQVEAVSGLLFPPHVAGRIANLTDQIARATATECGLYEVLNTEYSILDDAIHDIRNEARAALGLDSRWRRLLRRSKRGSS